MKTKFLSFLLKLTFLAFLMFYYSCSSYPNGTSFSGTASFNSEEDDFEAWQSEFSEEIFSLINIPKEDFLEAQNYIPEKSEEEILQNSIFRTLEDLTDNHSVFEIYENFDLETECENQPSEILNIETIYLKLKEISNQPFTGQGYELYSCANPDQPISMYFINIPAYRGIFSEYAEDGLPLSYTQPVIILVPDTTFVPVQNNVKTSPSFLYVRGHDTDHFQAAFDDDDYTKGIGFKMALQGFTVAVPALRSFDNNNISGILNQQSEFDLLQFENHDSYSSFLQNNFNRSVVAESVIDMAYIQSYLESDVFSEAIGYTISTTRNYIAGVSFGGQVSHLAGALDDRFEVVSTHGAYYGYEVINSSAHHDCQNMPRMDEVANIFDISMLVYPRTLHIAMGENDVFTNDYFYSALDELIFNHEDLDSPICTTEQSIYTQSYDAFDNAFACNLIFEVSPSAEHEFIINDLFIREE